MANRYVWHPQLRALTRTCKQALFMCSARLLLPAGLYCCCLLVFTVAACCETGRRCSHCRREQYARAARCADARVEPARLCVPAQVACGASHTLLLVDGGGLLAWGQGTWGQTGHGSTANTCYPQRIEHLLDVAFSQVLGCHSCSHLLPRCAVGTSIH